MIGWYAVELASNDRYLRYKWLWYLVDSAEYPGQKLQEGLRERLKRDRSTSEA